MNLHLTCFDPCDQGSLDLLLDVTSDCFLLSDELLENCDRLLTLLFDPGLKVLRHRVDQRGHVFKDVFGAHVVKSLSQLIEVFHICFCLIEHLDRLVKGLQPIFESLHEQVGPLNFALVLDHDDRVGLAVPLADLVVDVELAQMAQHQIEQSALLLALQLVLNNALESILPQL